MQSSLKQPAGSHMSPLNAEKMKNLIKNAE